MRDYAKLVSLASNGVIKTSDLEVNGIHKDYLRSACADGIIEKVAHGIYVVCGEFLDDLYVFQLRNKRIIYSTLTAAYLHDLTTKDTEVLHFSVPLHYNIQKNSKKIVVTREKEEIFVLGKSEIKTMFGNNIVCHGRERTVCDFLSPKYAGDIYIQIEVLKSYIQSKRERNFSKLFSYAKQLGIEEELRKRVQVLV